MGASHPHPNPLPILGEGTPSPLAGEGWDEGENSRRTEQFLAMDLDADEKVDLSLYHEFAEEHIS